MKWLRRVLFALTAVLAVVGLTSLLPEDDAAVDVFYQTSWERTLEGVVGFPSFNATKASDLGNGGVNADRQTTGGTLVLPPEASTSNKVPAMVILHGSGGDWSGRSVNLAMYLARQGIAGLAVDTFAARNLRATDDYIERLDKAPIYTQMADALSALQALQSHPYIDSGKIGVTGFSLGAGSTLYMMFEPVIENVLGLDGPRFSAYAMFYGGCMVEFDDFRVEGSPLLIMMGEGDESMSIPACERFRDKLRRLGVDVDLKTYADAGHAWDAPFPEQFRAGAWSTRDCRMRWTKKHRIVETSSGYSMDNAFGAFMALAQCANQDGHKMGYNESATKESHTDLIAFLDRVWGRQ